MSTEPERKVRLRVALISVLLVLAVVVAIFALRSMIPVEQVKTGTTAQTQNQPANSEKTTTGSGSSETNTHPESEEPASNVTEPRLVPPQVPSTENKVTSVILQPESGKLVLETEGKRLGEETYKLERTSTGEYSLNSQGFFSFNLLAGEVKFEYTQKIQVDANLRPLAYSLNFHGPLGLGSRSTKVQIQAEQALVSWGETQRQITVPKERFVLLGMFSSYALAAKLLTTSDQVRLPAFIAAGFEGPESQPQDTQPLIFPLVAVKKSPLKLKDKATGKEMEVEQYLLMLGEEDAKDQSGDDSKGLRLLAAKGEFWGLIGVSQGASHGDFQVYRVDLFPQGFDIVPFK